MFSYSSATPVWSICLSPPHFHKQRLKFKFGREATDRRFLNILWLSRLYHSLLSEFDFFVALLPSCFPLSSLFLSLLPNPTIMDTEKTFIRDLSLTFEFLFFLCHNLSKYAARFSAVIKPFGWNTKRHLDGFLILNTRRFEIALTMDFFFLIHCERCIRFNYQFDDKILNGYTPGEHMCGCLSPSQRIDAELTDGSNCSLGSRRVDASPALWGL